MEEQIFFNDEWNGDKQRIIERLKELQTYYNICLERTNKMLEEQYKSEEFQNKTFLPKEYDIKRTK